MSDRATALATAVSRLLRQVVHPPAPALTLHAGVVAVVLAMAAALRFIGLDWDQGQHQHPDERFLSTVLLQIQPAPDVWTYFDPRPLAPESVQPRHFVLRLRNLPAVPRRVARARAGPHRIRRDLPGWPCLVGPVRPWGPVLLVYLLGRRLLGPWPAVIAAALMTAAVHSIQIAHFFAVDTFATFFATLALWLLVRYAASRDARGLGLAGIAAGLAMASKLSTGLLLALFAGWWALTWLREGMLRDTWTRRGLWLGHLLAFGAFAALTFRLFQPYAFAEAWPWDWRLSSAFSSGAGPAAGHPVGAPRTGRRASSGQGPPPGSIRWNRSSAGGAGPRVWPGGACGPRPGGRGVVARADASSGAAAGLGRTELPGLRRIRAQNHALLPPGLPGTGPGGSLDVCVGLDAARATARAGGLGRRRSARVRAGCDGVVGAGLRADLRSRPHAGRGVGLHLQPCPFGIGDCRGALGRRAAPAAEGAWPGSIHTPATAGLRTRRRGETHPSDPDTQPGRSRSVGQRPRRGHHPAHAAALSAHGSLLRSPG